MVHGTHLIYNTMRTASILKSFTKKTLLMSKVWGHIYNFPERNAWVVRAERKMNRKFPFISSSLTMERSADMPSRSLPSAKGTPEGRALSKTQLKLGFHGVLRNWHF